MSELATVVSALTGPAGAMILLAIVLYGMWRLANRSLDLLSSHLSRIEEKFDSITDRLSMSVDKLTETIRPLALDMESIARQNDFRKPTVRIASIRDKEEAK